MRTTLLLAALAALFCGALAGPYKAAAGCHATDDIKKYPIEGFTFRDFVKGQFVKHSYVQAKSRMRTAAEKADPILHTICEFDGVLPIRACYNSIDPGTVKDFPQIAGQYGFIAHVQYICPTMIGWQAVKVPCKVRLNTLRDNRLLAPSFWKTTPGGRAMDLVCGEPITDGAPMPQGP